MNTHRCNHGGKPCPRHVQAFYHPQYPAHHRDPSGSALVELILGVVVLSMLILGLMAWSWIAEAGLV